MIERSQLDFAACVSSGQVFRFVQEGDGVWRGVDGVNLIEAENVAGGWIVSSRPDNDAWKRFLQIDIDLLEIHSRLVGIEPRLARLIEQMPGLRTLRPASAHETLASFLCTPNNQMTRIVRMAKDLASHGEPYEGHHRFPSLETIASLQESDLRANGFGYRSRSIPLAAASIVKKGGESWLESLRELTYVDARTALMSIPGIGPKLADCICLFGLHKDEAVPVDTHVWKTVVDWYLPELREASLTPARYELARIAFSEKFGELAGWAQQYVFYGQFLSYRQNRRAQ